MPRIHYPSAIRESVEESTALERHLCAPGGGTGRQKRCGAQRAPCGEQSQGMS